MSMDKELWEGLRFSTAQDVDAALERLDRLTYAVIPQEEYHRTAALSHSTLKKIKESPAKLKWELENPRPPSNALELGTAIHAALLEPDLFRELYVKTPKFDRRTKVGKADSEAWEEANKGKVGLDPIDWAIVTKIQDKAMNDEFFSQFFVPGVKESSFFVRDDETGLMLRCRPDNLVEVEGVGLVVVDLKSTDCALEHVFNGDIIKYGYLTAAAYYMDILEAALGERPSAFAIMAVEKSKDCDMSAFVFEDEDLMLGRKIYRGWLRTYAACLSRNEWPGYERGFRRFKTPEWLRRSVEETGGY